MAAIGKTVEESVEAVSSQPTVSGIEPTEGSTTSTSNTSDWDEHVDEATGKKYWYSHSRKKSTWEIPSGLAQIARVNKDEDAEGIWDWEERVDPATQNKYWYSESRHTSSWEKPPRKVKSSPGGALASVTKRTETTDNLSLGVVQEDGDEEEEGDTTSTTTAAAVALPGANLSGTTAKEDEDDWEEHYDEGSKKKYYYSRSRKQSSWNLPVGKLGALSSVIANAAAAASSSVPVVAEEGTTEPEGEDDWEEHVDPKTQEKYYYSPRRHQSIWHNPKTGMSQGVQPSIMSDIQRAAQARKKVGDHVVEGEGQGLGIVADSDSDEGEGGNRAVRANTHQDFDSRFHDDELNSAPPSFQGFLQKEGGGRSWFGRKSWKKRWTVISGVRLGMFKSQKAYARGDKPVKNRWINLEDYRIERSLLSNEGIRLIPAFGYMRTWYFKTGSPENRETWIKALGQICSVGIMKDLGISLIGAKMKLKDRGEASS